jgi:glucose dehydrogenase
MLKIKENWTLDDDGNCVWIYRNGDHYLNAYAIVVTGGNAAWVAAYPFGGTKNTGLPAAGGKRFNTAAEAHAYLIASGSESPWEESC